jgi:osmotically inducible lipoprotein OsmB
MRTIARISTLALVVGALAACGSSSDMEGRTLGGAGVGAGTGAAIGALFGGVGAIPGALIGGALGAGTGVVTDENTVDLGDPVWKR